ATTRDRIALGPWQPGLRVSHSLGEATGRPGASGAADACARGRRYADRGRPVGFAAEAPAGNRLGQADLREPRRPGSVARVPRAELRGVGAAASGPGGGRDAEGGSAGGSPLVAARRGSRPRPRWA